MHENIQSEEEFEHYINDSLKSLEIEIHKEENLIFTQVQTEINQKIKTKLENILYGFNSEGKLDPEMIFKKGISALSEVDQERFILENLLESLKNSQDSLKSVITKYNDIGITDIQLSPNATDQPGEVKDGKFLQSLLKKFKKMTFAIMQIIINAMKVIPKFVAIKPRIGIVGPFPSLSFELEAKALSINDLLETLRKNVF